MGKDEIGLMQQALEALLEPGEELEVFEDVVCFRRGRRAISLDHDALPTESVNDMMKAIRKAWLKDGYDVKD